MSGYDLVRELFDGRPHSDFPSWSRPFQRDSGRRSRNRRPGFFGDRPAGQRTPIPKGGSGMLSVALGRFLEAHKRCRIDEQARHGVHHRRWQVRRRALRGRQFVSRRKGGRFNDPHQASGRHGAERFVGRRFSRGCPVISPEHAMSRR